jgi:hypothetical protein
VSDKLQIFTHITTFLCREKAAQTLLVITLCVLIGKEFLWEMLEKLGVNVSELKKMSPAEKQLEGLYNGLIKLVETWTNTSQ